VREASTLKLQTSKKLPSPVCVSSLLKAWLTRRRNSPDLSLFWFPVPETGSVGEVMAVEETPSRALSVPDASGVNWTMTMSTCPAVRVLDPEPLMMLKLDASVPDSEWMEQHADSWGWGNITTIRACLGVICMRVSETGSRSAPVGAGGIRADFGTGSCKAGFRQDAFTS